MSAQPELVCSRCQPLEQENERLRQALASLQAQLDEQATEIAGMHYQLRRAGQAEVALRNKLSQAHEDTPKIKRIMAIQEFWKVTTKTTNVRLSAKGERYQIIDKALRISNEDELREAIRGAVLKPWVAFGRRYVTRSDIDDRKAYAVAEIKLGVRDILGDEERIKRHRDIYIGSLAEFEKNPDRLIAELRRAEAVEAEYARMALRLAATKDRDVEPSEETLKALAEADRVIAFLDAPNETPHLELAA